MFKIKPDLVIGGHENPYLLRWYIIPRNRFFNIYLHKFLRSDDDRALHDHPWAFNASILLKGNYFEHLFKKRVDTYAMSTLPGTVRKFRKPGRVYFRRGATAHRVELIKELPEMVDGFYPEPYVENPVWTIFITGARVREWGFYCPMGWRESSKFLKPNKNGESVVGKGCD